MTGIEFREGSLTLSSKCTMKVKKGMVFNVNVGFSSLSNHSAEESAGKTYALFLGDTVQAGDKSSPGQELTSTSKKKISSIAIFMGVSICVCVFVLVMSLCICIFVYFCKCVHANLLGCLS